MDFSRLLFCLLVAVSSVLAAAADVVPVAPNPSCKRRCGGIEVPYPFGLEPQCAIKSDFLLICKKTAGGATKLFHDDGYGNNLEVLKISVQDNKVWFKTNFSRQCYDPSTNMMKSDEAGMNITGLPYVLSRKDNQLIVLGCTGFAYMAGIRYIVGCQSTCKDAPKNGSSCSPNAGCCQVNLFQRSVRVTRLSHGDPLRNITHQAQMQMQMQIQRQEYPCNYVTVMERKPFNFSATYLTSTGFNDIDNARLPIVMEWGITRNTCNQTAGRKVSYACVANNSECVKNEAGHACSCSNGYHGNPYIVNGCKDIDECEKPEAFSCYGVCLNLPGTFRCQCPHGTYGSPTTKGGCTSFKNLSTGLIIIGLGVCGASTLLLLLLGGPLIVHKIKLQRKKKMKLKFFNQNHGLLLKELVSSKTDIGERMIISLRDLEKATDNFDSARVVGGGGHGVVFKGILDLHVVAIKKSKIVVQREIKEFINEVVVLSQVNHRNVVKLLGCCLETEVPLLVYEFISKGTLYNHLHVEGPISLLWADRMRIALEVTRALSYLHSAASMPIFHRDIKSSNILLDESLTAKVSDFGASRYIPIGQTGVTTIVQGTLGYLDPMYHYTGRLTDKSDVFSFGVLLIELLTRKKPFIYRSNDGDNLVSYFEKMLRTSNLASIVDPQVMEEEDENLQEVATLAVMCTKLRGEDRPTMRQVEMRLENLLLKKKVVPYITTPRRNNEDKTQVQYMLIEPVTNNETSRQYTMEEEILLSASYPR